VSSAHLANKSGGQPLNANSWVNA